MTHESFAESVDELVARDVAAYNLNAYFESVIASMPPKEAARWILTACLQASAQITRLRSAAVASEQRKRFAAVQNNVQSIASQIVRNHDLY